MVGGLMVVSCELISDSSSCVNFAWEGGGASSEK